MTATVSSGIAGDSHRDRALDTTRWAVVIPSYNHSSDAINCLESLRLAEATPGRVILVDDASTEDAVGSIVAWATRTRAPYEVVDPETLGSGNIAGKWLTIVASTVNAGFSVSCNIGLRYVRNHTDSPFALLLNNDAAVSRSYFRDLADGLAQSGDVGIATGTIYEWDQKTVWYAGGRFNPLRAVAEHDLVLPRDTAPRSTEFICGCTMLISRTVLENVGLLPECYSPCYCEDADYSMMAARAGFRLLYVPKASAYHRVGSSFGQHDRSPKVTYWFNRNRGYAMRRNFHGWQRAAGIGYLLLTKPARAAWEMVHGRPESAAAFIRGTVAGLLGPIPRDS